VEVTSGAGAGEQLAYTYTFTAHDRNTPTNPRLHSSVHSTTEDGHEDAHLEAATGMHCYSGVHRAEKKVLGGRVWTHGPPRHDNGIHLFASLLAVAWDMAYCVYHLPKSPCNMRLMG
jgi:hypothetical protein